MTYVILNAQRMGVMCDLGKDGDKNKIEMLAAEIAMKLMCMHLQDQHIGGHGFHQRHEQTGDPYHRPFLGYFINIIFTDYTFLYFD